MDPSQKKPLIGQTQNGHFGSGQLEVSFAGGSKKCHFGPFKGAEILLLAPKPPFLGGFGPLQGQILYWDADFWPFLQSFGQIWTPRGSFGGPILQSSWCPSTGFGWFWVVQGLYRAKTGLKQGVLAHILYWDTGLTEGWVWGGGPVLQSNRCPTTGFGWFWPIWACTGPKPP